MFQFVKYIWIFQFLYVLGPVEAITNVEIDALVDIIDQVPFESLTILVLNHTYTECIDYFICELNKILRTTYVFYSIDKYFVFLESNLRASIETVTFSFSKINEMHYEIVQRNMAHRLSLFIFYLGTYKLPKLYLLPEPLRVIIITNPKPDLFRIYYNQATPKGDGILKFINFYDKNSSGIHKTPVIPSPAEVYKDFKGRTLYIPVIHSPPWHFVRYLNVTDDLFLFNETLSDCTQNDVKVTGGRDDHLLKLIASKLNFRFKYCDPPDRTQGSVVDSVDNLSFSGGIGMLQRREADMFLGDIAISLERKKAIEFSVFTLTDSGAFVTHSPKFLNEALALIRPFQMNVWLPLIVTFCLSGPILWFIVVTPLKWTTKQKTEQRRRFMQTGTQFRVRPNFITYRRILKVKKKFEPKQKSVRKLFIDCFWFTIAVFMRQSADLPVQCTRVRLFAIIFWLAVTYVIADVYSAQLTSQLAKPAREPPINTLYKLENAMLKLSYQLYVERQSVSLEILENGTGVFHNIYSLMKHNSKSYLVSSIEEGVQLIMNNYKTVILGGRETLYFNIKRHGINQFQLSEKLYTRYSAVAVQYGCPYLDRLNDIIMRLFEANILEKITNQEYEKMFNSKSESKVYENTANRFDNERNRTSSGDKCEKPVLQPLNLKTLQGAFFILILGYILSGLLLIWEIESKRLYFSCFWQFWHNCYSNCNFSKCFQRLRQYFAQFISKFLLKHY